MILSRYTDYKQVIRERVKELRRGNSKLTLKRVASLIPIQYTYLSRVLNQKDLHLAEDHLYRVGEILRFSRPDREYLILLRSYANTASGSRRKDIWKKIQKERARLGLHADLHEGDEIAANSQREIDEIRYLSDPLCAIVFVSLSIAEYRRDPRKLATHLNLSERRLKGLLEILRSLGKIETGTNLFQILQVHSTKSHFSKSHPLMRVHQQLFAGLSQEQVVKTDEERKEIFLATFTADPKTFERIRKELQTVLKRVEGWVGEAEHAEVYQLNLQLFPWLDR